MKALALEKIKTGDMVSPVGQFLDDNGVLCLTVQPYQIGSESPIGLSLGNYERGDWVEYETGPTIIEIPKEKVKSLRNGVIYVTNDGQNG